MILGIVYFVMSAVIIILVINTLKLSDKVEELENGKDFWYREFMKQSEENEKLENIIENIKSNLEF